MNQTIKIGDSFALPIQFYDTDTKLGMVITNDMLISQGNHHNATTSDIPEGNKLYFTEDTTEKKRIEIEYTESDKFARTSEIVKTMFTLINQTEEQINELWEKALAL